MELAAFTDTVLEEVNRASEFHELCFHKLLLVEARSRRRANSGAGTGPQIRPRSGSEVSGVGDVVNTIKKSLKESWFQTLDAITDHFSNLMNTLDDPKLNDATATATTTTMRDLVLQPHNGPESVSGSESEPSPTISENSLFTVLPTNKINNLRGRLPLIEKAFCRDPSKWETIPFVKGLLEYLDKLGLQAFSAISLLSPGEYSCKILICKEEYGPLFEEVAAGTGSNIPSAELNAANMAQAKLLWVTAKNKDKVPPAESLIMRLKNRMITAKPKGEDAIFFIRKEPVANLHKMIEDRNGSWRAPPNDWKILKEALQRRKPVFIFFGSPTKFCLHGVAEVQYQLDPETLDFDSGRNEVKVMLKWKHVKDVSFFYFENNDPSLKIVFRKSINQLEQLTEKQGSHLLEGFSLENGAAIEEEDYEK